MKDGIKTIGTILTKTKQANQIQPQIHNIMKYGSTRKKAQQILRKYVQTTVVLQQSTIKHGRRTVHGMVIIIISNSYGVERPEFQHSKQRVFKVSHQMRLKNKKKKEIE